MNTIDQNSIIPGADCAGGRAGEINDFYRMLNAQLQALTEGIPYITANLANASALLYDQLSDINWAGFYLMEDGHLVLGPFQGKTACVEIDMGKGVCGTAALKDEITVVPDVHQFEGYIACDSASQSEIVLPIHGRDGAVIGVLDIDSPILSRFSEEDAAGLEEFVKIIEGLMA